MRIFCLKFSSGTEKKQKNNRTISIPSVFDIAMFANKKKK